MSNISLFQNFLIGSLCCYFFRSVTLSVTLLLHVSTMKLGDNTFGIACLPDHLSICLFVGSFRCLHGIQSKVSVCFSVITGFVISFSQRSHLIQWSWSGDSVYSIVALWIWLPDMHLFLTIHELRCIAWNRTRGFTVQLGSISTLRLLHTGADQGLIYCRSSKAVWSKLGSLWKSVNYTGEPISQKTWVWP